MLRNNSLFSNDKLLMFFSFQKSIAEELTFAHFGAGRGHIWMNGVDCTGNETSLAKCDFKGFVIHNCGHSEDAGVRCYCFYY